MCQTNAGRLLALLYPLKQQYTEIDIHNFKYLVFIMLPGIVKFIPEEMERLKNKLAK